MEKFNYGNFGKFLNEIVSNPDVVKKRDFLAEKAYEWFDISRDEIGFIDKDDVVKEIYKYLSLSFYIAFKNNPEASKIDIMNIKSVERSFPDEVYFLQKNIENWQYLLTYYSGLIDGLCRTLVKKDGIPFKRFIDGSLNEDEDDEHENGEK